ncbi:MAG TPA: hypothetical protein VGN57_16005 [Pirellulaceae bacterium]|jgi:hypothetical protein|nr:hypothetical protein [Pirellulaceae bacterium]
MRRTIFGGAAGKAALGLGLFLFAAATAWGEESRRFDAIDDDIDAALKQVREAERTIEAAPALERLVRLHQEIVTHEKYGRSPTLEKLELKIRGRIKNRRDDLAKDFDLAPPATAAETRAAYVPGARRSAKQIERSVDRRQQVADLQALSASIDATFLEAGLNGGPMHLVAQSLADSGQGSGELVAFGGGTIRDYGTALVDLITSTISPESWAVNGGASTIRYYAPLQALVVSAPSEVHPQIGGLLGAMRKAGN